MKSTVEKLTQLQNSLNQQFLEREDVVEGLILALMTGQHALLVGPPGTAKSQMIKALTATIGGANYFELLLSKFSKPEEVFGPISLKALEQDEYRRITAGKLPEAKIAFLDEVFKASTAILNSLLTIINERIYHNNGTPMQCPLITLVGASNELPEGDEETALAAFADRFLFRYQVGYLAEDSNFVSMLTLPATLAPAAQLGLADIEAVQKQVQQVAFGQDAVEAMVALRAALNKEGILVSDRRWRQSVSALQAKAVLAGSDRVIVDRDFDILVHILWTDFGNKSKVTKIVRRVTNPLAERVQEILEEAREIYQNAIGSGKADEGSEAIAKFKVMQGQLNSIEALLAPGAKAKAQKARDKMAAWHKEVLETCLGITI